MIPGNLRIARLVSRLPLTADISHFVFEVPEVKRIAFEPGQFIWLCPQVEKRRMPRPYSIASPPNGDNRFELCLNRLPAGPFSQRLFRMRPGEAIPFDGPAGSFLLRQPFRDSLFIATGTGIAPIRSMIGHLLQGGASAGLTLLFGARDAESILYRKEFEELAARHPNFQFHPTLSRVASSNGAAWAGRRGYVQEHLFELLGSRTGVDVYVCGLPQMVQDVRARLMEKGFDPASIFYEK
jgi:CDP-4-dehydro-6-deoxyglucose reductase